MSAEKAGDVQALYLLSVETGEMRKLTDPPRECMESLANCGDISPAYSPDGREIAFMRLAKPPGIYTVTVATSELKQLNEDYVDAWDGSLTWAADGGSVVFSMYPLGGYGLKRIAASGGKTEPVPLIEAEALAPSISRQGNRLAYEKRLSDWNVWRFPGPRAKKGALPRQLIASTLIDRGAQFSPDGSQIAFISDRSGAREVWVSDADGGNPRKPFQVSEALGVSWSPDGRWLAFSQVTTADSPQSLRRIHRWRVSPPLDGFWGCGRVRSFLVQ